MGSSRIHGEGCRLWHTVWAAATVALFVAPMATGQPEPVVAPRMPTASANAPRPVVPKVDPLTLLLQSDDAAQQQKGLDGIRNLFAREPARATGRFAQEWFGRLIALQRYQDVLDVSSVAVANCAADMQVLERVQQARVQSLIAMGKPEEALAASKSYFNVASMRGTAEAIKAVVQCLNVNPTPDANRLERFKAQQMLSSNSVSALKELAAGPSILGSIHVNSEPYDAAIRKRVAEDFVTLTERGNLLLLADRVKDAKDVFERAYVVADDMQLALASENLARAMKAEDGNIARANEWVLSIRPPAKPPAPPPAKPSVQPLQ